MSLRTSSCYEVGFSGIAAKIHSPGDLACLVCLRLSPGCGRLNYYVTATSANSLGLRFGGSGRSVF